MLIANTYITFYKVGSLVSMDKENYHENIFYDIESGRTFNLNPSSFNNEQEIHSKCLEPLDTFFLVKKDIIHFNIVELFSMQSPGGEHLYQSDGLYNVPYNVIYSEVLPIVQKKEIDRYGKIEFVASLLFKEHWSQCFEGDWDCHIEYLGIAKDNFDETSLLTEDSKKRYDAYQKEIESFH